MNQKKFRGYAMTERPETSLIFESGSVRTAMLDGAGQPFTTAKSLASGVKKKLLQNAASAATIKVAK